MPRNNRRNRNSRQAGGATRPRRRQRRSVQGGGFPKIPPMFKSDLVVTHKFRFYASALVAANRPVTWANLCTLYGFSLNTTVIYSPVDSVKLQKVEMWGSPPVIGGLSTVGLEWGYGTPSVGSDTTTYTDSSPSSDTCPHIKAFPPSNSTQAMWHDNTDTNVAFYVACPAQTTVDVTVQYHLIEDQSTVSLTGSGYTANVWYFCRMDGPAGYFYAIAPGGNTA